MRILGSALTAILCFASALSAQTTTQQIKTFYEDGLKRNGIIGSSLILIRNGEVALHDNYGKQSDTQPVDDNTT